VSKKIQPKEYAIVDIETTGGNASGSRITEIAILIHDGEKIIDRYETLVNPQRDIPLQIFALTGINNEMVKDAPVFGDIAETVFRYLDNRIFVAHNVNFDYSFIKHQLELEGFKFSATKLCTVRMSRKIRPGFYSYSLGNLCNILGIDIQNRHRAGGDAEATAILFGKLIEWDEEGIISEMIKKNSKEQQLPPNLPKEDFLNLPSTPGVYYFRDQNGKVIYVGKAINLKKRVASHFTGHNPSPQRQHFMRSIYNISYEICATEMMALLLECSEIKRLWPAYNRALKKYEPQYGMFLYEDIQGYKRLAVSKYNKQYKCVQKFNREFDGIKVLLNLIEEFNLDIRLVYFGNRADSWDITANPIHDLPLPTVEEHNSQVELALESFQHNRETFALIDKGRNSNERSCIWIEEGEFYGMGYFEMDTDLTNWDDIKQSLDRYPNNHYIMQLIESFREKNPSKIIFPKQESQEIGIYNSF
jgi:DNA polymerase-3 subunit epsilon